MGAVYEAAEVAKHEAKRQETLRLTAEALDLADKRRKRRRGGRRSFLKLLPRAATLVVVSGSGALALLVLCSFRPSAALSFQASWPVCSRRTVLCSSSTLAVALLIFHLALCSFLLSLGP